MTAFTKRSFGSFSYFRKEASFLWRERKTLRSLLRGQIINDAFRERLIMAVTAVNRCRYCSFVHSRAALKSGVTSEELKGFFSREVDAVPEEERVAVLYAQHWAETRGYPDDDANERLHSCYSPDQVNAIQIILRFINFNNLFGNTVDRILHTLSLGWLGGEK